MTSPGQPTPAGEPRPSRPTREQRIVDRLVQALPDAARLGAMEARAQALPALLRRHGPVQVLLFLAAKGAGGDAARIERADLELSRCLVAGIEAALAGETAAAGETPAENVARYAEELAAKPLPAYLLRWEIALEVAGWIKMLVGARRAQSIAGSGAAPGPPVPESDPRSPEGPPAAGEAAP